MTPEQKAGKPAIDFISKPESTKRIEITFTDVFTPDQTRTFCEAQKMLAEALRTGSTDKLDDFLDKEGNEFLSEYLPGTGKTPMSIIRSLIENKKTNFSTT